MFLFAIFASEICFKLHTVMRISKRFVIACSTASACQRVMSCGVYVLIILILFCCESKSNAVYELCVFRTEIKNHGFEYTVDDWENAYDRYSEICHSLDEMSFTDEEQLEIDKIKGEIAGYAASVMAQDVTDRVEQIASEIESFADGFNNTFQTPKSKRKW